MTATAATALRDVTESAQIRTPRRGECRAIATTTSTQVFKVPGMWFGKKVRFEAVGDTVYVQTAPDATISITPAARDTITGSGLSAVLTAPVTTIGEPIADGMIKEWDFDEAADVYIGIRGVAGGGVVFFHPAEITIGADHA